MGKKAAKKNVFDTCFFSAAAAAETTTDKTFKAITMQKKKIKDQVKPQIVNSYSVYVFLNM